MPFWKSESFLNLETCVGQDISGKNHQDSFLQTWPLGQFSPEDQSVPFRYQI